MKRGPEMITDNLTSKTPRTHWNTPTQPIFSGLRFALSGFSWAQTNGLKKLIASEGGVVDLLPSDKTSFLVTPQGDSLPTINTSPQTKTVAPEFISASISNRRIENPHSPTKPPPPQVDEPKPPPEQPNPAVPSKKRTANPNSAGKWRTVRVFISSTFKDMHGERDHLTRVVFPELQARCQKLRVHIYPVDLRWGVTEEDTENALEVCLTELDSCRPFFIGLLGNRYGWVPESYKLPDKACFDWIKNEEPGKSITHLEMEYGALTSGEAKAAFYLRDDGFEPNVPYQYKSIFQPENAKAALQLKELKEKIVASKFPVMQYSCRWKGLVENKPMVEGLEAFGNHVTETFWEYLQDHFPAASSLTDPIAIERSYHDSFIESHSNIFIGRQSIINTITDFAKDKGTEPLVITGQPGAGKTSLISYVCKIFHQQATKDDNLMVISYFIGASPGSLSIRHGISHIIMEIGTLFGLDISSTPSDFKELTNTFQQILQKVPKEKKLILTIDALNQLDSTNSSHTLNWLPETFPENVRVILSTLDGKISNELFKRSHKSCRVGPLSREERAEIVTTLLWAHRKKLSAQQLSDLLDKEDAEKPLYLVVACEELRVFGVYEDLSDKIDDLPRRIPHLFEEVLRRLEEDHSELLIKCLSFITLSKGGLLQNEMLELLGEGGDPLPQVKWAKLYRSIQNYLRPLGESGEGFLDFFHQQFPKAVLRLYLSKKERFIELHTILAEYFLKQADPEEDGTYLGGNARGFRYVVYHQIQAKMWSQLRKTLCDIGFIESKCEIGMTYDLVSDYLGLVRFHHEIPEPIVKEIEEYQKFVMSRAHVLVHSPSLTFSMAMSFPESSCVTKQANYRYYTAGLEKRPFLRWLNKPLKANPCIMTLNGHDMVVQCCSVSPDSEFPRIVSASDDGTLKTYDAVTGEELLTLKGHKQSVTFCDYSGDGMKIVSGGIDRIVRVWSGSSGQIQCQMKGHKSPILCCTFHPQNEDIVASSSKDKTVRIWESGKLTHTLEYLKVPNSCRFSHKGDRLAVACQDNLIQIYETTNYQLIETLRGHMRSVNSVVFSSDDSMLVSTSDDRSVIIWKNGEKLQQMIGHKDGSTWAVFSNDMSRVISCSHDNLILIWETQTGKRLSMLIGHTGSVFRLQLTPKGDYVVSCSYDRSVKIWEVRDDVENVGHEARILTCAFSPDTKYLATGSRDKTAKVWDTLQMSEVAHLEGHGGNIFGVCWSPNSKLICTASRDKTLKIWNITTKKCEQTLSKHTASVRACTWSPDGKHLLSASEDKTLIVWDTETWAPLFQLFGHRSAVISCHYSPDGLRLASGSEDNTIKIWDTKKGSLGYGQSYHKVGTFSHHTSPVNSICFHPGGRGSLLTGADDSLVVLWDSLHAKVTKVLSGHKEAIRSVCWTSGGHHLISGSTDSTIRMWNPGDFQVDCSFACLSRLCALSSCTTNFQHFIACGDGSGVLYILTPVGLDEDKNKK